MTNLSDLSGFCFPSPVGPQCHVSDGCVNQMAGCDVISIKMVWLLHYCQLYCSLLEFFKYCCGLYQYRLLACNGANVPYWPSCQRISECRPVPHHMEEASNDWLQ